MFLIYTATGADETEKIDLSAYATQNQLVTDEGSLYNVLLIEVANFCLLEGVSFEDAYPTFIYDVDEWAETADLSDKAIDAGHGDGDWLLEIAKFAWFVEHGTTYLDRDQIFAWMNDNNWRHVDFDNLEDEITENYSQEFDGDHEAFAIEWMSNVDESIPDFLEPYFDFAAYGEALINDMRELEWNGSTYLYYQ